MDPKDDPTSDQYDPEEEELEPEEEEEKRDTVIEEKEGEDREMEKSRSSNPKEDVNSEEEDPEEEEMEPSEEEEDPEESNKPRKKSKGKSRKMSLSPKEPATSVVRSSRKRKAIQRFSTLSFENASKGHGTQLKDTPNAHDPLEPEEEEKRDTVIEAKEGEYREMEKSRSSNPKVDENSEEEDLEEEIEPSEEEEEDLEESKKLSKNSKEKSRKMSLSPKEPATSVVRSSRKRKAIQWFSTLSFENASKGHGTQLKDTPNVVLKLSKRKPDEKPQELHSLLLGKRANTNNLKKNIKLFSASDSESQKDSKHKRGISVSSQTRPKEASSQAGNAEKQSPAVERKQNQFSKADKKVEDEVESANLKCESDEDSEEEIVLKEDSGYGDGKKEKEKVEAEKEIKEHTESKKVSYEKSIKGSQMKSRVQKIFSTISSNPVKEYTSVASKKAAATDDEPKDAPSRPKGSASKKDGMDKKISQKNGSASSADKTISKTQAGSTGEKPIEDQGKCEVKKEPSRDELLPVVRKFLKQLGTQSGVDLKHRKTEMMGIIEEVLNNIKNDVEDEDNEDDSEEPQKDSDEPQDSPLKLMGSSASKGGMDEKISQKSGNASFPGKRVKTRAGRPREKLIKHQHQASLKILVSPYELIQSECQVLGVFISKDLNTRYNQSFLEKSGESEVKKQPSRDEMLPFLPEILRKKPNVSLCTSDVIEELDLLDNTKDDKDGQDNEGEGEVKKQPSTDEMLRFLRKYMGKLKSDQTFNIANAIKELENHFAVNLEDREVELVCIISEMLNTNDDKEDENIDEEIEEDTKKAKDDIDEPQEDTDKPKDSPSKPQESASQKDGMDEKRSQKSGRVKTRAVKPRAKSVKHQHLAWCDFCDDPPGDSREQLSNALCEIFLTGGYDDDFARLAILFVLDKIANDENRGSGDIIREAVNMVDRELSICPSFAAELIMSYYDRLLKSFFCSLIAIFFVVIVLWEWPFLCRP